MSPASSEGPVGRGCPILGAADANKMPPSKHTKIPTGKEASVLVVDLISSRVPTVCDARRNADQRNQYAKHTYI